MPDLTFAYPLPVSKDGGDESTTAPVCGVNLRRAPGLSPEPWLQAMARLPVSVKGIPLSSFQVWTEGSLLRQLDPNSPDRFDPALYHGLDLMIGTAFHSVLFAVQAAVPVIAIDYAPKVRNFMADVGLEDFVLSPAEPHLLPELVTTVLERRSAVAAHLKVIRERLGQDARRSIACAFRQIEASGQRHFRFGPKVSVVVAKSGDQDKDRRSLDSCLAQTYENVEVLTATRIPRSTSFSHQAPLDQSDQPRIEAAFENTLARCSGEYVTWIDGGDWLARDMLDCLVAYLEKQRQYDVVYADYYFMSDENLPLGHHSVPGPHLLYRRDVVGPCFLVRRGFLDAKAQLAADPSLVGYGFWLQARESNVLAPFHAPLFYSARPIKSMSLLAEEREVRRGWRRSCPPWGRAFWRLVDTDLGERLVVRPAAGVLSLLRRKNHARRA